MEAVCSCETSGNFYHITRRHIPDESIIYDFRLWPSSDYTETFRKLNLFPSSCVEDTREIVFCWVALQVPNTVGFLSYPVHLKAEIEPIYEMKSDDGIK
jgi:hypothetical protein